jgi:hypothetical protein
MRSKIASTDAGTRSMNSNTCISMARNPAAFTNCRTVAASRSANPARLLAPTAGLIWRVRAVRHHHHIRGRTPDGKGEASLGHEHPMYFAQGR